MLTLSLKSAVGVRVTVLKRRVGPGEGSSVRPSEPERGCRSEDAAVSKAKREGPRCPGRRERTQRSLLGGSWCPRGHVGPGKGSRVNSDTKVSAFTHLVKKKGGVWV